MLNWLFEGRIGVYIVLAAVALVLLAIWWRRRQRQVLVAAGVALTLVVVYWLLSFVPTEAKTDRVEISHRLEEMANGISQENPAALERYVSDKFVSPRGLDKDAVIALALLYGKRTTVKLSDITFPTPPSRSEGKAKVNYRADVMDTRFHVEAVFDWHETHHWRLRELHIFPPVGDEWKQY